MKKLFWFVVAGGSGFLVDSGILFLLLHVSPLNAFAARIISIAAAMATTWIINRTLAFQRSRHGVAGEAARYGTVAIVTACINYGIYSALLLLLPSLWPVIAAALATGVTMVLSFFGYSKLVFGGGKATEQTSDNDSAG